MCILMLVVSMLVRPTVFGAQKQFLVNPALKTTRNYQLFTGLKQPADHNKDRARRDRGSPRPSQPNSSEIDIIGKVIIIQ